MPPRFSLHRICLTVVQVVVSLVVASFLAYVSVFFVLPAPGADLGLAVTIGVFSGFLLLLVIAGAQLQFREWAIRRFDWLSPRDRWVRVNASGVEVQYPGAEPRSLSWSTVQKIGLDGKAAVLRLTSGSSEVVHAIDDRKLREELSREYKAFNARNETETRDAGATIKPLVDT